MYIETFEKKVTKLITSSFVDYFSGAIPPYNVEEVPNHLNIGTFKDEGKFGVTISLKDAFTVTVVAVDKDMLYEKALRVVKAYGPKPTRVFKKKTEDKSATVTL